MTKNTIILLLLSLACFWCPSVGICSPTYMVTEDELLTLEQHLSALEANNDALMMVLAESNEDLQTARAALTASKQELQTLRAQLQTLKDEANAARQSLATAQKELDDAAKSLKASEAAHGKTEGRLKTQRNIWEALFFVACGIAATR